MKGKFSSERSPAEGPPAAGPELSPGPVSKVGAAPGVPPDYHQRIYDVELDYWWHRGMRNISRAILGKRLQRGGTVLDAGCGTGGFLRWLLSEGPFTSPCGVDISEAAITLARERVPEAELSVSALRELPFQNSRFDLIVSNDVLQHVAESEIDRTLAELRRVLRPDGAMLLRTTGARRARRERHDWRAYDRRALALTLEAGGFRCDRLSYANMLPSLWGVVRGRTPRAPTETSDGIAALGGGLQGTLGDVTLRAEARYLAHPSSALPYGHTLLALATPASSERSTVP